MNDHPSYLPLWILLFAALSVYWFGADFAEWLNGLVRFSMEQLRSVLLQ